MTSRIAICFGLRLFRRRVRGASDSGAEFSLMVLLQCVIRRPSSNVGGPWWGVLIETVSENRADLEDLFERVGLIVGGVSKNT